MIFQHTHKWIFDVSPATGQPKTHTRRIIKRGQKLVQHIGENGLDLPVVISAAGKRLHYVGQNVAAQPGRTMKGDGKIRILDIQQQDVRNITNNDARAEGFYHSLDFLITWCGMHDITAGYPHYKPTQYSDSSRLFMDEYIPMKLTHTWLEWASSWLPTRPNSHYLAFAYRFEAIKQEQS